MQMAVIEAARNLVAIEEANSTEFGPTKEPLVGLMTEWLPAMTREGTRSGDLGGTCRLGAYPAAEPRQPVSEVYGRATEIRSGIVIVTSQHRYKDRLEQHGLRFSGLSPDGVLPEIVNTEDHPCLSASSSSRTEIAPVRADPLFASFHPRRR